MENQFHIAQSYVGQFSEKLLRHRCLHPKEQNCFLGFLYFQFSRTAQLIRLNVVLPSAVLKHDR